MTADYASGIHWEVQHGRFLSENDIDNALQVCVLGANAATELFGETSPLGQEVRIQVIPFLNNYIPFATFAKYLKLVIWAIAALV